MKKKPVAVSLQETFLKDSDKFTLKYHSCYYKLCSGNDKASGGVALIVNNNVPHHSVKLDSALQAVAVSISLNITFTLCSVYLPPVHQLITRNLSIYYINCQNLLLLWESLIPVILYSDVPTPMTRIELFRILSLGTTLFC